ncbi:hypothetical protein NHJ13734_004275 [Beauveria thailandica]
MCRGHPKHHRCAHTSVSWYYCPSAYLDMGTGAVSPCGNPIMNDSQPTKAACPLQHCRFSTKGSSWVCCQCNQGPNTQGWCTQKLTTQQMGLDSRASGQLQMTCDHGCCENCTGLSMLHLLSQNVDICANMTENKRPRRDVCGFMVSKFFRLRQCKLPIKLFRWNKHVAVITAVFKREFGLGLGPWKNQTHQPGQETLNQEAQLNKTLKLLLPPIGPSICFKILYLI